MAPEEGTQLMVFSSAPFLFIFLPVVLILYTCIRGLKGKNALLIAASLFLYAYGEPVFVLVMVGSVLINYLLALGIGRNPDRKKPFLVIAVIVNLGMIGVFKYAGFAVYTLNQITGLGLRVPNIALPIGISFFTFQVLSYVIDVYRDPGMVQKNFARVLLYVSFFPQLIAGPIVKYHDVYQYINDRKQTVPEVAAGIRRFVLGLAKKLFLANSMGMVADQMFGLDPGNMSAVTAWMGAICYILQIFFDFSGYSDMAIGLGHMFGFTFLENFDHPYIATGIKEFWRRWHISLSTWFREYLYIPLGGNRKGRLRTEINKLIVFFFTGLWHGASWNFVLWGMIHGAAIVCEDLVRGRSGKQKRLNGPSAAVPESTAGTNRQSGRMAKRFVCWLYTIVIVIIAFVFFRADTLTDGVMMIRAMFAGGFGNAEAYNACISACTPYHLVLFVISVIACLPLIDRLRKKLAGAAAQKRRRFSILSYVLTVILFVLCILNVADATYNPFIYFRF